MAHTTTSFVYKDHPIAPVIILSNVAVTQWQAGAEREINVINDTQFALQDSAAIFYLVTDKQNGTRATVQKSSILISPVDIVSTLHWSRQ